MDAEEIKKLEIKLKKMFEQSQAENSNRKLYLEPMISFAAEKANQTNGFPVKNDDIFPNQSWLEVF